MTNMRESKPMLNAGQTLVKAAEPDISDGVVTQSSRLLSCLGLVFLLALNTQTGWAAPTTIDPVTVKEEQDAGDEARTSIVMDPINFNLIRNGKVEGAIAVDMIVELVEAGDFEEIKARQPFLQSDFLQALTSLAKARFRLTRPINPDLVVAYLQPVADRRLGAGKVNLLVRSAIITPVN